MEDELTHFSSLFPSGPFHIAHLMASRYQLDQVLTGI
jgi:hypothetical protein